MVYSSTHTALHPRCRLRRMRGPRCRLRPHSTPSTLQALAHAGSTLQAPPTRDSIHGSFSVRVGLRSHCRHHPRRLSSRGARSMVHSSALIRLHAAGSVHMLCSVHAAGSIHAGYLHAGLGPRCRLRPQGESVYAAGSAHMGLRPRCKLSECGLSPRSSGSVHAGLPTLQAARDTRLSPHSRVPSLSPRGTAPGQDGL